MVAKFPSVAITFGWINSTWLSQVGTAGLDLDWEGVAIARRSALDGVGDEYLLTAKADLDQQLVQ